MSYSTIQLASITPNAGCHDSVTGRLSDEKKDQRASRREEMKRKNNKRYKKCHFTLHMKQRYTLVIWPQLKRMPESVCIEVAVLYLQMDNIIHNQHDVSALE